MTSTEIKNYVLNKIEKTDINIYPFYNLYVENIFPDDFYQKQLKKYVDTYVEPLRSEEKESQEIINNILTEVIPYKRNLI